MIKIYFADATPLDDDILFNNLLTKVSASRREKVSRFQFRRDKNLSLAAGILLKTALDDFLAKRNEGYPHPTSDPGNVDCILANTACGEHGKPYFTNMPELHFNISHSVDKVMVAVSDCEIGCDIENMTLSSDFASSKNDAVGEAPSGLEIARRFFSEREFQELNEKATADERRDAFFTLWVMKESFMKATGLGMALPPDQVTHESIKEAGYIILDISACDDYKWKNFACALCLKDTHEQPQIYYTDLKNL